MANYARSKVEQILGAISASLLSLQPVFDIISNISHDNFVYGVSAAATVLDEVLTENNMKISSDHLLVLRDLAMQVNSFLLFVTSLSLPRSLEGGSSHDLAGCGNSRCTELNRPCPTHLQVSIGWFVFAFSDSLQVAPRRSHRYTLAQMFGAARAC